MNNSDYPAFPQLSNSAMNGNKGITKREYFIGAALKGLLGNPETFLSLITHDKDTVQNVIKSCFDVADGILNNLDIKK